MATRPARAASPARVTAFYARVTSDESVKNDLSLPNQAKRFRELAEQHGWEGKEFVETAAVSGELGPEDRPALRALLDAVRSGRLARVVVRHLDRLGRGVVLEETIALLRDAGVELWSFDGRQDIHSAAGRLGVRAQAMVGAFEVERTGERVREMKRQKARNGEYVGPTPYGFTSQARLIRSLTRDYGAGREDVAKQDARETCPHPGRLVVDEAEAEVVREIFRLYVEQRMGCRRIARALHVAGHRTREGYRWSSQSVLKIVRDPKVAGYVTFDEDAYAAHTPSARPVHEQTLYDAKHKAIITKDLWDAAQELRGEVGARLKAVAPGNQVHALRGVVWCAHGHRAKARTTGPSGRGYYTCTQRCLHGVDAAQGGCSAPAMPITAAEDAVREVLTRLLANPRHLHEYLQAANRAAAGTTTKTGDRAREIEAEIVRLEASRARYYRLLEATEPGSDEEQAALERVVELKRSIQALRDEQVTVGRVVPLPATVAMAQVEAFVSGLRARLTTDPAGFRDLIAALHRDHDLRVELVSETQVRVSLAIDPGAMGKGPRLVATARPRIAVSSEGGGEVLTAAEWARRENEVERLCACGCTGRIVVAERHRWHGIPRYLHGHGFKVKRERDRGVPEGWMTVGEAAKAWGAGETTVRRMCDRGEVEVRWVEVRGKRVRVVRRSSTRVTKPTLCILVGSHPSHLSHRRGES